jgi:hypothetical protein
MLFLHTTQCRSLVYCNGRNGRFGLRSAEAHGILCKASRVCLQDESSMLIKSSISVQVNHYRLKQHCEC